VPALNEVPGFHCIAPEGCYVAFANITGTGKTSLEVKEFLLENAKVAVVPGLKEWFGDGATGFIRLSFATSEGIVTEGMQRIQNAMK
jgi:bifunctional pyridoxal-dependent enzyme with beta-cystathionase and maltose regulon repressor activities